MPKIVEYTAPGVKPNLQGQAISAWDTAARHVAPLYEQAAQEMKEAGHVKADMERSKIWPFNIAALYAHNAPHITNSSSVSSRSDSSTTVSDDAPERQQYNPPPTIDPQADKYGDHDWSVDHGEASAGAAGMSRLARSAIHMSGPARALAAARGYGSADIDGTRTVTQNGIAMTPYESDMADQQVFKETRTEADYQRARQEHVENRDRAEQDRKDSITEKWDNKLAKQNAADQRYADDFARRRDQGAFERDNPGMSIGGKFDPSQASTYRDEAWQKNADADQKRQAKYAADQIKNNSGMSQDAADQKAYEHYHVFGTGYQAPPQEEQFRSSDIGRWTVGQVNDIRDAPPAIVSGLKDVFGRMFQEESEGR